MRNNKGFTLTEVAVVMALIGLVASIAVPSMMNWRTNQQLGGGARDILGVLQKTRLQAIRENSMACVDFDPDGNGSFEGNYRAFVDDSGGFSNRTFDAGELIIREGQISAQINMTNADFGGSSLVAYNARGLPVDAIGAPVSGSVMIKNSHGKTRTINLTIAGGSSIQDY